MKLRTDFVTNSSSAGFVVRNNTNQTKTMWDLLEECAAGPWELVDWPHYDPGEWDGMNPRGPPKDPKLFQEFKEAVARLETFPPHSEVTVTLAWGDGGPIFCPQGLTWGGRSFSILDSWSC